MGYMCFREELVEVIGVYTVKCRHSWLLNEEVSLCRRCVASFGGYLWVGKQSRIRLVVGMCNAVNDA